MKKNKSLKYRILSIVSAIIVGIASFALPLTASASTIPSGRGYVSSGYYAVEQAVPYFKSGDVLGYQLNGGGAVYDTTTNSYRFVAPYYYRDIENANDENDFGINNTGIFNYGFRTTNPDVCVYQCYLNTTSIQMDADGFYQILTYSTYSPLVHCITSDTSSTQSLADTAYPLDFYCNGVTLTKSATSSQTFDFRIRSYDSSRNLVFNNTYSVTTSSTGQTYSYNYTYAYLCMLAGLTDLSSVGGFSYEFTLTNVNVSTGYVSSLRIFCTNTFNSLSWVFDTPTVEVEVPVPTYPNFNVLSIIANNVNSLLNINILPNVSFRTILLISFGFVMAFVILHFIF